jgi:hypothetical protein
MIEFTARGSGYYRLYVNDVEISRHVTERECIERAVNEKTTTNIIHYVHDYTVDVVALTDAGITEARSYAQPSDLPPTITSTPTPLFQYLVASSYDMTQHVFDDGVSTVTYFLSNVLPNGLTFNGSTGILSYDGIGTESVSSHQLTATDAVGNATSALFNITISAVDPFTFTDQTLVTEGNTITSNAIVVTGIISPQTAQISVSLGEYQINGGSWVSAPGFVTENDSVVVRHIATAGQVDQVVTIGAQQDTFSSTTEAGFAVLKASRTSGVSPCPILFSVDGFSTGGLDEHDFYALSGFYWDFDNPAASRGTWSTGDAAGPTFKTGRFRDPVTSAWETERDKNIVIGSPQAAHTFIVPDGGGTVNFTVLVNYRLPDGTTGQLSRVVTVQAQDNYYTPANTIAVSSTLNINDDWSTLGFDRSPPAKAVIGEQRNTMPGPDEVDGKRIMVFNDDQTQWPEYYTRMGQSNAMFTYFGNEKTGINLTAATISFEAPPVVTNQPDFSVRPWNAGGGLIKDSANGLGNFKVGHFIEITGSSISGNNRRWKIQEVSAGEIKVHRYKDTLATDAAGPSVTVTEHHRKPRFWFINAGVNSNSSFSATNTDVATYGWPENVTFDSLEIGMMLWPMSYKHFTAHNIDGDNTLEPKGNETDFGDSFRNRSGVQIVQRSNRCWDPNSGLDSSNVPLLRGAYISEWVAVGNPDADWTYTNQSTISFVAPNKVFDSANGFTTGDFGVSIAKNTTQSISGKIGHLLIEGSTFNDTGTTGIKILSVDSAGELTLDTSSIVTENAGSPITLTEPSRHIGGSSVCGGFNQPLATWTAVYGCVARKASEHTMRINGGYRIFVYANDFEGEHGNEDENIGPGGKHACALRGSGYGDMGDLGDGTRTRAIIEDQYWNGGGTDFQFQPRTAYYIQHNNWVYPGNVGNATSLFQISTDWNNLALMEDCIVSENWFEDGGVSAGSQNVRMHGRWMTSRGHKYRTGGFTRNLSNDRSLCTEYTGSGTRYDIVSCTPFDSDEGIPIQPSAPR